MNTATTLASPGALRRRAVYLHLQELVAGRDVVELGAGLDAAATQLLKTKGARRVTQAVSAQKSGLAAAGADVVLALDVQPADLADVVREARRALRPDGVAVIGIDSKDRPAAAGSVAGASYYDVVDACAAFDSTKMIGLAPFAGTTLVEYGVADPEPILDGTMVERGERVDYYVAVAGPERRGDFGYGVVQLPIAATSSAASGVAVDDGMRARVTKLEAELAEARRGSVSAPAPAPRTDASQDRVVAELRQAVERHAGEMRARETELAERDAYIKELELDARRVDELEGRAAQAEKARANAEHAEREARRRIAELEGKLRAGVGAPIGSMGSVAPTSTTGGGDDIEALQRKLAAAEAETWKALKARSETERVSAELREDTVRKLRDARKLASVELQRAMEEATKKAIRLGEELTRSEAERKGAIAELKMVRERGPSEATDGPDREHHRDLARAREEGEAAALAARATAQHALSDAEAARLAAEAATREAEQRATQLRGKLVAVERALESATRERDQARANAAAEEARSRATLEHVRSAGTSEGLETVLREATAHGSAHAADARDREGLSSALERAKSELADRERRLSALEQERPPRVEVDRQRGELDGARARIAELGLELQRRDAAVERAASAAAHERARAERLVAGERQALAERNDARARAAEAQAKVAGLEAERERAQNAVESADARAHKSENEVKEKRERIRQLKRELEDAERRAEVSAQRGRTLEVVRARVQALEAAVAGEAARVAGIEQTLRGG